MVTPKPMRFTTDTACALALVAALGCAEDPAALGPGIDASAPGPTVDAAPGGVDAADDGEPADASTLPAPTWSSEMTADATDFYMRHQDEGSVQLGAVDDAAGDGVVARLAFPGIPGLGNADRVSPAFASELATNRSDFHYGVYRVRVKLAGCAPDEEVVNGIFTYFNDGTDHDGDGIADNSEIDLEVLCGAPNVLFMTVWTDYAFETETFRKWTRVIDFDTGDVWQSPAPDQYGIERVGNEAAFARPGLLAPGTFIDMGFEWRADRVRYFATIDGAEVTLAELTEPDLVPQLPGHLMFNVWHPASHWFGGGGPPDYPASDAVMIVDRAAYWR